MNSNLPFIKNSNIIFPIVVQSLNHVWLFVTPWTAVCQASLSITNSGSLENSCSLSRWCHPTISSSVVPFSSCTQSFPASGSFQTSQLLASGGQSIGVSASKSVLPMNTQVWSLGWTGWLSLQSKGPSRLFSSTTVQKHQIIYVSRWSNHLILCHPLLLLPSIFPSIRVFSSEWTLRMRWRKYWSFSFKISPTNEHPGLISFRMDWLALLEVQGTLESLLQYHISKASILWCSTFFIIWLSHPYMTTGKAIALTRWTFFGKVISSAF